MKNKKNSILILLTLITVVTSFCFFIFKETDNSAEEVDLAVIVNGVSGSSIPTDRGYDVEVSCLNATGSWNRTNWSLDLTNFNKNHVKCNLVFTKGNVIKDAILKNEYGTTVEDAKTKIAAKNAPSFNSNSVTDEGLHVSTDNYGDTYFFRGKLDRNYVYFAGFYWRIIRINGDGSIRMIYSGIDETQSDDDAHIGKHTFNTERNLPGYTGYMYGNDLTTSYETAIKNEVSSNVKNVLDSWYEANIKDTTYENYISDTIFCNDRTLTSGDGFSGTVATVYAGFTRLRSTIKTPTLSCTIKNDTFTVSDAIGNQALTYSIALITADEVNMAGLRYDTGNPDFYLNINQWFWAMTPYQVTTSSSGAQNFILAGMGSNSSSSVTIQNAVRPVINLKGSTIVSGTGTLTNPYKILES